MEIKVSTVLKSDRGNSVVNFIRSKQNVIASQISCNTIRMAASCFVYFISNDHCIGRAAISKGLLLKAKKVANENVAIFKDHITAATPLVGIEPSAILSFRDEYPKLVDQPLVEAAKHISKHAFMIEEFLAEECRKGKITLEDFTSEEKQILLHGHCHQKSLGEITDVIQILSLPSNFHVSLIPSGCCGMAGSFGYEKEHFDVSMSIGNMVLFPAIKKTADSTIICASGTSCRHQIADATQRQSLHPVEIFWGATL